MSDYTPSTESIRANYADGYPDTSEARETFDRWLAARDAELIKTEREHIRSTIGAYAEGGVDAFDAAVSTIDTARQRREEQPDAS